MISIPQELISEIKNSESIAILTGAGVSAESGIKTFRDPDGLWAKFNPMELASIEGFMNNPELVWDWYQHRVEVINNSKPNPGHYAIAEFETMFPDFTLITQNVDRLHQKAGSKNIFELHGNIIENLCFSCKTPFEGNTNLESKELPKCLICGGNIRPNVVWFGEQLPRKALYESEKAATRANIFFTIGTSAEVYPAANLPIIAKQNGAIVIEVNPNDTSFSPYADYKFSFTSAVFMPELVKLLKD